MYMDEMDPESGDAMDAILSNAANMLGKGGILTASTLLHLLLYEECASARPQHDLVVQILY